MRRRVTTENGVRYVQFPKESKAYPVITEAQIAPEIKGNMPKKWLILDVDETIGHVLTGSHAHSSLTSLPPTTLQKLYRLGNQISSMLCLIFHMAFQQEWKIIIRAAVQQGYGLCFVTRGQYPRDFLEIICMDIYELSIEFCKTIRVVNRTIFANEDFLSYARSTIDEDDTDRFHYKALQIEYLYFKKYIKGDFIFVDDDPDQTQSVTESLSLMNKGTVIDAAYNDESSNRMAWHFFEDTSLFEQHIVELQSFLIDLATKLHLVGPKANAALSELSEQFQETDAYTRWQLNRTLNESNQESTDNYEEHMQNLLDSKTNCCGGFAAKVSSCFATLFCCSNTQQSAATNYQTFDTNRAING